MPTELFSLANLGSYATLVTATFLIVSFFKEKIKPFGDWYVRLFAVLIAFAIQCFVFYANGALTIANAGTAFLNAFLVAMAAAGANNFSKSSDSIAQPVVTAASPALPLPQPQSEDVRPPEPTVDEVDNAEPLNTNSNNGR